MAADRSDRFTAAAARARSLLWAARMVEEVAAETASRRLFNRLQQLALDLRAAADEVREREWRRGR